MKTDDMFPRELSVREFEWIAWLLPGDRPGYKKFMERVQKKFIIGEGRWGKNDFVLGDIGGAIDRTEGMRPVVAFGAIHGEPCDVTISLHQPNDDGQIEFQIATSTNEPIPESFKELSRWTYSTWLPGEPCPATHTAVREIILPASPEHAVRLVIAPQQKVLWLHDAQEKTNTLVPVTNFYNELMLAKRIRDPKIALDHRLLFQNHKEYSDADLIEAFVRYNVLYKKVALELFDKPAERGGSFWKKLFRGS